MRSMVSSYRKGLTPRALASGADGDGGGLAEPKRLPLILAHATFGEMFYETETGVIIADRRPLSGDRGFVPFNGNSRGRGVIVPGGVLFRGYMNGSTGQPVIVVLDETGAIVRQNVWVPGASENSFQGGGFNGQRLVIYNATGTATRYSDDFGATFTDGPASNLATASSTTLQYAFHDGTDFVFVSNQSTSAHLRTTPDGITITNKPNPPWGGTQSRPVYSKPGSDKFVYNTANSTLYKWDVATKTFVVASVRAGQYDFFEEIDGKIVGLNQSPSPYQYTAAFPDGTGAAAVPLSTLAGLDVMATGVTGFIYPILRPLPDGRILFAVCPSGGNVYSITDRWVLTCIFKNLEELMAGIAMKRSAQRMVTSDVSSFLNDVRFFSLGRSVAT